VHTVCAKVKLSDKISSQLHPQDCAHKHTCTASVFYTGLHCTFHMRSFTHSGKEHIKKKKYTLASSSPILQSLLAKLEVQFSFTSLSQPLLLGLLEEAVSRPELFLHSCPPPSMCPPLRR
jgi:hypothetical protein